MEGILRCTHKQIPYSIADNSDCKRDFTYVDDIVEGVVCMRKKASDKVTGEDGLLLPPYKVYIIGNNGPDSLAGDDLCRYATERLQLRGAQGTGISAAR